MIFKPNMYKKNIYEINYDKLENIKCLVFDLDNTIALIDQHVIDDKTISLFKILNEKYKTIIISNNNKKQRVEYYADILNCDYVYKAKKPLKFGLNKIKNKYNLEYKDIAIIGDQLVTDILLSNRCGCTSILVDPLGKKDLKITGLNRYIENKIIKRYSKKNIFNKGDYYE